MSATLHFVGGPADGETHAWHDFPPTLRFPMPPLGLLTASEVADELEPVRSREAIYERRRGVVANEAVYDFVGST